MPLMNELKNGDEVEIILSEVQTPPAAWESAVITGKARSAIRRATKEAVRKQYRAWPRHREGGHRAYWESLRGQRACGHSSQASPEMRGRPADLGRPGRHHGGRSHRGNRPGCRQGGPAQAAHHDAQRRRLVQPAAREELQIPHPRPDWRPGPWRGRPGFADPRHESRSIIHFAGGGAVPGERIVGILDPGQGITIYPIHSRQLQEFEDQLDRWIDVTWDIGEGATELFPARIRVVALNEPGSLGRIASIIGAEGDLDRLNGHPRARLYRDGHRHRGDGPQAPDGHPERR